MENLVIRLFIDEDFDSLNNTVRWNGKARIKDESVAHHTYISWVFARVILEDLFSPTSKDVGDEPETFNYLKAQNIKLRITTKAGFHDFDESFSGDILHTVKYNQFNGNVIRQALKDFVEFELKDKLNLECYPDWLLYFSVTDNRAFEKLLVKLFDWLALLFYVSKEISLGNKRFLKNWDFGVRSCKEICRKIIDYQDRAQEEYMIEMDFKVIEVLRDYDYNEILNSYNYD